MRCWGYGEDGQLGYAIPPAEGDDDPATIGDNETPGSVDPVSLGARLWRSPFGPSKRQE